MFEIVEMSFVSWGNFSKAKGLNFLDMLHVYLAKDLDLASQIKNCQFLVCYE